MPKGWNIFWLRTTYLGKLEDENDSSMSKDIQKLGRSLSEQLIGVETLFESSNHKFGVLKNEIYLYVY